MPSTTYELSFEVPAITDEIEDSLVERLDAVVGVHSGVTVVTLLEDGETALQAALRAALQLERLGAPPLRLVDDLVSRSEIARRATRTPQAVGQWIRGARHAATPFPRAYVVGASELWLWGEVVPALRARGIAVEDDVEYPSRRDILLIAGALAARSDGSRWATVHSSLLVSTVATTQPPKGQVVVDSKRTDFALAS